MKIKLLFTVLALSLFSMVMQAQMHLQQPCTMAMSNTFFQQKLNQINNTYDARSRFNQARTLVMGNCLSSWQVKQVAMALADDMDKLEFCKTAYPKTTDPENFYDVYDAFAYFSTAFRLHDFVSFQRTVTSNTVTSVITTTNNNDVQFPALPYPDYNQYLGPTGCSLPVSEEVFMGFARELKNSRMNDQAKSDYAKNLVNNNCLSTSQIMKLATLLANDNYKLELLKTGIPRVYDRNNYASAQHVFSTQPFKNEFISTLYGQPNNNQQNTQTPCTVSQTDFDEIKRTVNNTSFASSKVTVCKQAVQAKKCFTVKQIKELIGLFSFDDNKLDIAKFCYDYCTDKSNYYQVNDVFSFTSSKDELTNYIQGRQ